MYNFSISKDTYTAVITWLDSLGEYDYSYERMRINEIKTRRIQQKATQKPIANNSDTTIAYMNVEPVPEKTQNNLNLELLVAYVKKSSEDINDSLEDLSQTISYFTGVEEENSIDFFK